MPSSALVAFPSGDADQPLSPMQKIEAALKEARADAERLARQSAADLRAFSEQFGRLAECKEAFDPKLLDALQRASVNTASCAREIGALVKPAPAGF